MWVGVVPRLCIRGGLIASSPGSRACFTWRAWHIFSHNLTMHGKGLIKKQLYFAGNIASTLSRTSYRVGGGGWEGGWGGWGTGMPEI